MLLNNINTFNQTLIGFLAGHAQIECYKTFTKCQDSWYDYESIYTRHVKAIWSVTCCCGCLAAYRRETIENFVSLWINRDDEIKNSGV